jgi:phenylalanyl-tRNA synthetase beta chain
MGHYGVARDLRAGIAKNNQLAPLNTVSTSSFSIENYSTPIEITVQSQEKAPRYLGIVVSDIRVAPSPAWLQHRLKAIGLNPINNVVDCTNYILHGLGQPLHAFDYDKIEGKKVVVRTAEKEEKLLTLDGVERELHTEDLVICDSKKPMCIAGVFGGLHSGVTENTTSVLIESAYFDPVSVRKTSKRHGLHTDASFRFERGVDINTCVIALKRAAIILKEIAGGTVSSDLIESYPKEAEPISLFLNYAALNRIAGTELPKDHVKNILVHLEFKVLNETEAGLGIVVPTYRNDVTREIDVIEEVFRVYGYNNIPIPEKFSYTHASSAENQNLKFQNEVSDHLVASGYVETLSNSLTLASNDSRSILLKNALSSDLESLRTEMFSSGIKTLAYNANRQQKDLKIFEFGKVYHQESNERREQQQLLIMATGRKHIQHWLTGDEHISFYDLKSICATLLHRLEISDYSEQNLEAHSFFDKGISLSNDKLLAEIGVVSKEYSKSFGLTQDVVSILIYWDNVIQNAHKKEFDLNEITKHPQVYRDLALILDENIKFGQLLEACHKAESKLLKGVRLFDVYTGKGVPSNKKSYAIQLQFNDSRKTLTDKEIDKSVSKIFKKLESDFGAVLRS